MNGRKKLNGKYFFIWIGSLVLLVIAIMGPKLLFTIQDNFQIGKIRQGKHLGLSVDALNNSYKSLKDRMTEFAAGLTQGIKYYVTGTDYIMNEDFFEILEEVLGEEQATAFEMWGMEPYLLFDDLEKVGYDTEEWKKYVIYDDFMEDGNTAVVATAWYIELLTWEDCRVKILADTESNTIYYIQFEYAITELEEKKKTEKEESYVEDEALIVTDAVSVIKGDMLQMFMIWNYYYEADEINEEEVMKAILDTYSMENEVYITYSLNYGNNHLQWEMGGEDNLFYMGIKEFGQLIPELQ